MTQAKQLEKNLISQVYDLSEKAQAGEAMMEVLISRIEQFKSKEEWTSEEIIEKLLFVLMRGGMDLEALEKLAYSQ
jgi:hypothetical protein